MGDAFVTGWSAWTWFFVGVAGGLLLAVPLAWVWSWTWSRRTAERVRAAEQRARSNERLAELGTMTSGLAHEIKNPLSTLGLHIQLLREDIAEIDRAVTTGQADPAATHDQLGRMDRRFGQLEREAARLRDILEDFLRFAGRVELDPQRSDVNGVIDELIDFYLPQAQQAGVNLRAQITDAPLLADVDVSLFKQAMLNLLINATQAMSEARDKNRPHGGASELMIKTGPGRDRLGHDTIDIHVIDTGPGMSEDVIAKIFQPYFSTKRTGTGLGLPTTRRLIEEHGGSVRVHSEPGRGTDFQIQLPVSGGVRGCSMGDVR